MRMSWSTVSNAADRAISRRRETRPTSNATLISDTTLRTAVSVEWCGRYADCVFGSNALLLLVRRRLRTRRSRSFESTMRLEIGLYDEGSCESSVDFLSIGRTCASLKEQQYWVCLYHLFQALCLTTHHSRGSHLQHLF